MATETDAATYDEAVRAGLEKYISDHKMTHADMAKNLGFTPTRVTKFLNLHKPDNKPETDAKKVEAAARAFLRHASRRADFRSRLYENTVTADIAGIFKTIRRTGDMGLIHGPAGVGKTCGAELFCRDNPNTLFITAKKYACGKHDVENMLFEELVNSTEIPYPGNVKWSLWMEQVLRGTERLIVVDNANRLQFHSFQWMMDFHDATLVPIAFVGNPEVLDILRRSDQLFSRIGLVHRVKSQEQRDAEQSALKLIGQYAPGSEKDLTELAVDVISKLGASRTLKKQLTLTRDIREGSGCSWKDAFEQAGEMLIKPAVPTRRGK
jgi:DNA transposition AAA+ family ATPase